MNEKVKNEGPPKFLKAASKSTTTKAGIMKICFVWN